MTGSQHFILSFVSSVCVAALLSFGVFMFQERFNEWGLPPYAVMFVVFGIGHFTVRWLFSSYVAINCPFGCGNHGHPIPGRTDRFRCESCGKSF